MDKCTCLMCEGEFGINDTPYYCPYCGHEFEEEGSDFSIGGEIE